MLHDEQRLLGARPFTFFADQSRRVAADPEFWAPAGRSVELSGRGTAFVREVSGPRGAPTVVLLHGWFASASINWFRVFEPLGRQFHVVAPDLRGHGLGLWPSRRFRLDDCADDVAALMDALGIPSAIMVGYSMGGPIAQLMWRRHRARVDGLVLCATSHCLVPATEMRWPLATAMSAAAGTTRAGQAAARLPLRVLRRLPSTGIGAAARASLDKMPLSPAQRWTAGQMRSHDWPMVFQAGDEIGRYNARRWIGQIDVPTAVVVTTRDSTVPPRHQVALACAIPHASIHRFDDNHFGYSSPAFAKPVVAACTDVAGRAYPRRSARRGLRPLHARLTRLTWPRGRRGRKEPVERE